MVPGYSRSTWYKLRDEDLALGHPRYLACHEFDNANLPLEQLKLATGTEWSTKTLGAAKKFEADTVRKARLRIAKTHPFGLSCL